MIEFNATQEETTLIAEIAKRAKKELGEKDIVNTMMNITATHCNGCRLDLQKLLDFDTSNFAYDIYGIEKHIDKNTGELTRCFLPRCAAKDIEV